MYILLTWLLNNGPECRKEKENEEPKSAQNVATLGGSLLCLCYCVGPANNIMWQVWICTFLYWYMPHACLKCVPYVTSRPCPERSPRLAAFPGRRRQGSCGWTYSRCQVGWWGRGPAALISRWSCTNQAAAPWRPGFRCSWFSQQSDTKSRMGSTFTHKIPFINNMVVCLN